MRKTNKFSFVAVVTAALAMVFSGLAMADQLVADGAVAEGDEVELVDNTNLAMGEVCATDGSDGYNGGNDQPVNLYLKRTQNPNSKPEKVWANSTVVSLTHSETHADFDVTMPTPSSITTPSGWTTSSENTLSDPAQATVRVETETLGALSGNGPARRINFAASGTAVSGATQVDDRNVEVSALVVDSSLAAVVDCYLPEITIHTPAEPVSPATITEIEQGSTVASDFSCEDAVDDHALNTEIESCTGQVTVPTDPATVTDVEGSGFDLPTAVVGTHTLTVTAVDNAGNVNTATRDYEVVEPAATLTHSAFRAPIDRDPVINKAKAGRAFPLKWRTTDEDGNGVTGLTDFAIQVSMDPSCSLSGQQTDTLETYSTTAGGLQDLSDGYYQLDWKSPADYVNKCRRLTLLLSGTATTTSALLQFTK